MVIRPQMSALALLVAGAVGCGEDSPADATSGSSDGGAGGGGSGCPPGELIDDQGSCVPPGVPADACSAGFVVDSDGSCAPVLPPAPCEEGTMALPGETRCREVAPCGGGRWGDEAFDPATTEFVDASYAGTDSDGSEAKPWKTIQEAIDAAPAGGSVAIAAGSYHENPLVQSDPVLVRGRCPSMVEVVGEPGLQPAFVIATRATSGSVLRGIAVRGGSAGVAISGPSEVVVEQVWVHDTPDRGVDVEDALGPTEVTLRGVLVERAAGVGIYAAASQVTIEDCAVRDTDPDGAGFEAGHGIQVQALEPGEVSVQVRGSVIERNTDMGIVIMGALADIEGTVVRGTSSSVSDGKQGRGLHVQLQQSLSQRSSVTVRGSYFEHNHELGISVASSDLSVDTTVVRDTLPRSADGLGGIGLSALGWPDYGPTSLTVRRSLVERSQQSGIAIGASTSTLESVWIRDTLAGGEGYGRGFNIQGDPEVPRRATALLRGCVLERSREIGVFASGADVDLDSVRISDTFPNELDQSGGRGVSVQAWSTTGERSTLRMTSSLVERSLEGGVFVIGSDGTLDRVVVRETAVRADGGGYGDGVGALSFPALATVSLIGSRIEANLRAAVVGFGGQVAIVDSVLECNPIQLDAETYQGVDAAFSDQGGNRCGCGDEVSKCQVSSSNLSPPEPLAEPPRP